jgi:hypothetical protein
MLGDTGGVHHATCDPGRIAAWWAQDPKACMGVATGSASRLAVIDLDVKGSADGRESLLAMLQRDGLALPPGPWARTPSGGVHVPLALPREWGKVPERPGILPGVDVKGDGGYVVAWPSMRMRGLALRSDAGRPGDQLPVQYRWHGCPCTLPDAPAWMPGWLSQAPAGGGARGMVTSGGGGGETGDRPTLPPTGELMHCGVDHPHDTNLARLAAR